MIAQCLGNWVCASGLGGAIGWAVGGVLTYAWDGLTSTAVTVITNTGCYFYGNIGSC